MMGAFDLMTAMLEEPGKVEAAFRTGGGVPWGDHQCMFCAVARFFRPGYQNNLVQQWLPALDGVVGQVGTGRHRGRRRLRPRLVHRAHGQGFPQFSHFVGYDFHRGSIEDARSARARARRGGECPFRGRRRPRTIPDDGFDLVTFFDCLHDMGDPAGAAAHVQRMLKPDGSWMIVEPMAGDRLEDNLNPVGRLYYAGSTMVCVPTSLSQEVGAALGAQAGEAKLREVITAGGFKSIRRAAETPFNMILEAQA